MKNQKLHLLILEDNTDDVELIVRELEKNGFVFEWKRVETEKVFKKALAEKPDIILAVYNLPYFNGMAAIKLQQQIAPDIPLIIVSGTIGEDIAVECLKAGATDYVLKNRISRLSPIVNRALKEAKEHEKRKQAEKALLDSKQQYHALFKNANDAIFIMKDDYFIECNTKTLEMFGCTMKQIINQPPYRFSPATQADGQDSKEKASEKISRAFKGKPQRFEWRHVRYDKTPFDAEVSLNRLDISGKYYLLAIVRDITERKQAEQKIEESEKKYRNIFESANDGIIYLDILGKIKDVSEQAVQIFGGTKEELINKHFTKIGIFSAKNIQNFLNSFKKALSNEKMLLDLTIINKKEKRIDLECSSSRIRQKGKTTGIIIIARDITEYTQAQEELQESEKKYKQLAETAKDVIMVIDLKGNVKYINQEGIDLCGYSKEEALKMNINDVLSEDKIPLSDNNFAKRIAGDKSLFMYEIDFFNKKGDKIPVEIKSSLITEYGKPSGVLIIARDITERKKIEKELQNRLNELETYHKITLGREGRIIEIKQEVNNLLERLGEETKYGV